MAPDASLCGTSDPSGDEARQAALESYGILDTPTEPLFDDIARLAADICEAPIAVVNFVGEDRQWFKAEVGIGQRELPLDVSICRHAILQPGVLVVPDLREDARFSGNPLVTPADGLRFYAGALLETPEGIPIGTVCVLDREPRADGITERQSRMLQSLARQVMSELELRKSLQSRGAEIIQSKISETAFQETSRRLDAIINNTTMALFVMDENQQCAFMNKAAETLTGYSFEETRGQHLHDVIHYKYPDGRPYPSNECPIDRAFPDRNQVQGEELFVHKDGSFYPVAFTASPIRGEDGKPIGTIIEARGIAEEQKISDELRERTSNLEVLNGVGAAIAAEIDLDKIVQLVTDAGTEITGARFGAFFYNSINEAGESLLLYSLSGANRSDFDGFGHPRATEVFAPTFNGEGVIRSDDITKDPRYGKNDPHYGMPKGHLPVRSYLAVPVISRSEEVIGGLFFAHPETARFQERHEQLIVGIAAQAAVAIDNARLYQAQQHELARRRNAEEKLQELAHQLEQRVEERTADRDRMWLLSTDLMLVSHFDGTVTSVNPAWTNLLGWSNEELIGSNFLGLLHPDDVEITSREAAALSEGQPTKRFENRYRTKSGEYRWLSWTAVPDQSFIHAVARDVTSEKARSAELEQAQEALRQAQKMEAVGQLTGGIAHDFNNLLTVITGNLDLARRSLPDGTEPRITRAVKNALTGAERAATLTQRLLAFSRRQPLNPKQTHPNKLIAGMSELLHRSLGETVDVETVLEPGAWLIDVDPHQLENAILNLALNGRDAIDQKGAGGGKLTIETANTHLDRAYAAANIGVEPGQYVVICVSDTGVGMDADTAARAVEPFFTTKEVGKGTGLGLSMIYGFLKQSGGHLKVYSEVGLGTTVKMYLPKLLNETSQEDTLPEVELPHGSKGETILVCEDDDDVRTYTVEVLRDLGYRVIEAHDGPSALRLLERQEHVDLLFTDVVLPGGLNGSDVSLQARSLRPDLKVLFTTGYARNAIVHQGRLDQGVELITKPFTYADLAARVREILDRA